MTCFSSIHFISNLSDIRIVFLLTMLLHIAHRLNEAVMHFGESIKEIINEEFGDGM
jgi:hypothetical protein